ncbi:MAG TPA: alpha/beta hydrolase [Candidatus Limnocylindria bacterium]|nr:alpha/beta hydrolase [Candidatus Limnocylindria bacterium]
MVEPVGFALRALAAPWIAGARWGDGRAVRMLRGVAQARASWTVGLKAACDEVFYLSELLAGAPIAFFEMSRLRREAFDALDQFGARGWLDRPDRYHRLPPPLTAPVVEAVTAVPGLSYEHLTFPSEYAPWDGEVGRERWLGYAANRTAHARVFRHPGRPRPWVMCVPGYRMGAVAVDIVGFQVAWLFGRLGLNVVIPVLPFHGPRRVGRRGGDGYMTGDFIDTIHAQAQSLWDIRRVLSWVRAQEAPAIGVYGISLGGLTTAMLATLESEVDCVVAGMPPACFAGLMRDNSPAVVQRFMTLAGFPWDVVLQLLRVVSPLAAAPRVPHERRFLFAGIADSLAPRSQALALWRHWGRPRLAWYPGSHSSFMLEPAVRALLLEAFDRGRLVGPHRAAA